MKEKILFIQTAFPGDAILSLPAIQKLSENNSGDQIDVLANPATEEIFRASPFVTDVIVIDKRNMHKSIAATLKFSNIIKRKNYSKIYSAHRSFRTALVVLLAGVRETYGFDNSALPFVYKNIVHYENNKHEVQRNLNLIGFGDIEMNWKIIPLMKFNPAEEAHVNEVLLNAGKNKIAAVAPGSIWNTKRYPSNYYREIIDYLIRENFYVVLTGGREDEALCNEIMSEPGNSILNTAGQLSITESILLLKHCKLLVCNDSAPTHMGMAAGIPVITIYCSTVPEFGFYPYNEKSTYLSFDALECKPCGIHGHPECPLKHFNCGYNLSPDRVIKKLGEILS